MLFYIQKQNTKSYAFNSHIEVKSNIFANQRLESDFQNKNSSARRVGCESESCASSLPIILKFSMDGEYALKKEEKCTKSAQLRVLWTKAGRAGCLPFSTD